MHFIYQAIHLRNPLYTTSISFPFLLPFSQNIQILNNNGNSIKVTQIYYVTSNVSIFQIVNQEERVVHSAYHANNTNIPLDPISIYHFINTSPGWLTCFTATNQSLSNFTLQHSSIQ